jgi:hypothetical protein
MWHSSTTSGGAARLSCARPACRSVGHLISILATKISAESSPWNEEEGAIPVAGNVCAAYEFGVDLPVAWWSATA